MSNRCVSCGNPIEAKQPIYRISTGEVGTRGAWKEKSEWGKVHRSCFMQSIASPDAVLKELRRQTREVASAKGS